MQRTTRLISTVIAAAVMLGAGACRENPQSPTAPEGPGTISELPVTVTPRDDSAGEPLTILCGSSFRPPMEKLTKMYEEQTGGKTELSFGGSEDHLPNVKAKLAGDVYVSHTPFQQYTRDAGAMLRDVEVGFLAPVLVVAKGNPREIKSIDDLTKPGLQVILTNPEFSTCGEMTLALLEKKQIKDAVLKNVGNAMFKHHGEVGNKMKLGFGDAGIMWNGVAANFLDALEIVPVPYEYDEEIRVSVMGLSYTKQPEEVKNFLDFVEAHGKDVFEEFGYVK